MARFSEAQAWNAIADTLQMIKGMPVEYEHRLPGLCAVVSAMYRDRVISWATRAKMHARLQRKCDEEGVLFLFRPGEWRPRVELSRRFAQEARHGQV